ncbi:MAG: cadmium resistance transporter [Burkholderiales bacterium]|nr:cadmium resistance transporter [Anaerolineae bacterium]
METVIAAVVAFVATNIDDIFLLAIYFTQVDAAFHKRHIVLGQYIGFAAIFAVSLLGFVGALVIPEEIIGWLGFAPIYMGIKRLIQRPEEAVSKVKIGSSTSSQTNALLNRQTYSVAVVTFANGGDNISIYIPLFAGKSITELGVILTIFAVLIGVWCYLGYKLGSYPFLSHIIKNYGHIIVPFVLIGLGVYILIESHTLTAIGGLFR